MDLSALGLPMEQLRDVWLIAFMVHLGLCLLVDIAYPVPIRRRRQPTCTLRCPVCPLMRRAAPLRNVPRWMRR